MDCQPLYGLAFKMTTDPAVGDMRDYWESLGRAAFVDRYGYPSEDVLWLFEAASVWTDPETGEDYDLPDQWVLLVEGREPSDTPPSKVANTA